MGMTCTFSGEESAKRRCSDVASGPGNQRHIGGTSSVGGTEERRLKSIGSASAGKAHRHGC